MKKLLAFSLVSSSIFLSANSVKADIIYLIKDIGATPSCNGTCANIEIKEFNTSTNSVSAAKISIQSPYGNDQSKSFVSEYDGKIYLGGNGGYTVYDPKNNTASFISSSGVTDTIFHMGKPFGNSDKNDLITTNSSNISSNDTDIASNASNISSNDTDIASNASNISSNNTDIASNASNISSNDTDISGLQSLISTKSGSTTTARIGDSTKNILEIGPTTNPTTINQSGISVSGGNLIKKDSDGNIHIGKNSFVIGNEVLNGAHPIWAEDENGSKIPLNIYGSDLQINGKSVQGQIDDNASNISTNTSNISTNTTNIKNLGEGVAGSTALTAALSALPQTSKESKLSCGVGTGAYSSRYALGFGCASKVNERVDINAGGSYVFGGSKSYGAGTLDSGVIKAGFVFKLGELNKPTLINMNEKEKMEDKIYSLEEKNEKILSKNKKLEDKVSTLIARLERLEKVALNESKSQDLATIKLP